MSACPMPKISQVMMKWRRQASHLGRFDFNTLWNNGHQATQLGRFTLWHYGRLATQLGRFNLWAMDAKLHNSLVNLLCGTTAAELNNPV